MFRKLIEFINNSSVTKFLRAIEPYLVIFALITFLHEVGNWRIQRDSALWQQVSIQGPGDLGRKVALEQLNSLGIPLTNVDLSQHMHGGVVVLNKINLTHSKIDYMNFSGSKLREANFNNSSGYSVIFNNEADLSTDLREAEFISSSFSDSILCHVLATDTKFNNAVLPDVFFIGANLVSASFKNANLDGTHFHGCNLSGVDFSGANLKGAYFSNVLNFECEDLKKGENWQQAYRDKTLECGVDRPKTQIPIVYYSKEPSVQFCKIGKYQRKVEKPDFN